VEPSAPRPDPSPPPAATPPDGPWSGSGGRRRWAILALLLGTLALDQATKRISLVTLPFGRRVTLLGDVVRLEHARNEGGFLGMGARLGADARGAIFLWGVAAVIAAAGAAALWAPLPLAHAVGLALVAGGGLGNLVDRIRLRGYVIDFMNLGLGSLRTGVFNVADVAIVAGVILLLVPARRRPRP
jgi:signal peptidase II